MNAKIGISLIGLFMFFFLLFNAPLIHLPNGLVNGVPSLMIYIGIVWIILVFIMLRFASKKSK